MHNIGPRYRRRQSKEEEEEEAIHKFSGTFFATSASLTGLLCRMVQDLRWKVKKSMKMRVDWQVHTRP
jgi:hypothetical protein